MHRPSIPSTWRSVMVLQFAARIQLNLSLLTVSLHSCCSKKKKKKNGEKVVNKPHRLFAAPAKVKGYLRSPFQKKKKKAFDQRALLRWGLLATRSKLKKSAVFCMICEAAAKVGAQSDTRGWMWCEERRRIQSFFLSFSFGIRYQFIHREAYSYRILSEISVLVNDLLLIFCGFL